MMKVYGKLLLGMFCTLVLASTALSSSLCDQTFTVYGKTKGENSLLFWEVIRGGACEGGYGCSLVLGDSVVPVMTFNSGGGTWITRLFTDLPVEKAVKIEPSEGAYKINDSISIDPPPEDTTFVRKFSSLMRADPKGWYRACPVNCSDYPIVHGCQSQVVYAYKGGVYKNYQFKDVIYYPESNYIVIVTDQPAKTTGLDTMHGLLVIRLTHTSDK